LDYFKNNVIDPNQDQHFDPKDYYYSRDKKGKAGMYPPGMNAGPPGSAVDPSTHYYGTSLDTISPQAPYSPVQSRKMTPPSMLGQDIRNSYLPGLQNHRQTSTQSQHSISSQHTMQPAPQHTLLNSTSRRIAATHHSVNNSVSNMPHMGVDQLRQPHQPSQPSQQIRSSLSLSQQQMTRGLGGQIPMSMQNTQVQHREMPGRQGMGLIPPQSPVQSHSLTTSGSRQTSSKGHLGLSSSFDGFNSTNHQSGSQSYSQSLMSNSREANGGQQAGDRRYEQEFPALGGKPGAPQDNSVNNAMAGQFQNSASFMMSPSKLMSGQNQGSLRTSGNYEYNVKRQRNDSMGQSVSTSPRKSLFSNQTPIGEPYDNYVQHDPYSLLGLLKVLKMTDRDLNMLALGTDLTTLGLDLSSPNVLYATFASPWAEAPLKREPEFNIPACYFIQPDALLPPTDKMSFFTEETLFYIFYSMPHDTQQVASADELYARDWRYHKDLQVWFQRLPGTEPIVKTATYERGSYWYWDVNTWEKCRKDNFMLEYDKLEQTKL